MEHANHFSLFVLPATFDLDVAELTSRYLTLQKIVHPDKFTNASEAEKFRSVQQTANLNDAFNTLKEPLSRARYLLELKGFELNDEKNTVMDTTFLMQQMALRETIDAARNDINVLDATIDHIDNLSGSKQDAIRHLFSAPAPDLERIASLIREMQFFSKLRADANALALNIENH